MTLKLFIIKTYFYYEKKISLYLAIKADFFWNDCDTIIVFFFLISLLVYTILFEIYEIHKIKTADEEKKNDQDAPIFVYINILTFFLNIAPAVVLLAAYCTLILLSPRKNNIWLSSPILPTVLITTLISCNVISKKNKKNYALNFVIYFLASFVFFIMCLSNKVVSFFLYYESFLILSCVILSLTSQNKRSTHIITYFIFWTQTASFFLLIGVVFLINVFKIKNFYSMNLNLFNSKNYNFNIAAFIILTSFCVKVPTWPFHFWLTKTHVEASTGFSMYLSGLLVKISTVGFVKFNIFFNSSAGVFAAFLFIVSIVDVAIKIVNQEDLKKIVAMATVLEMNTMSVLFMFSSTQSLKYIVIFFCFHTLISGFFFYLVDVVYKKTASRVVSSCCGSMSEDFMSSSIVVVSLMFFLGLPGTVKFSLELYVLSCLLNYNILIFSIILISSGIFNFFFFKSFVSLVFLKGKKNYTGGVNKTDLSIFFLYTTSMVTLNLF